MNILTMRFFRRRAVLFTCCLLATISASEAYDTYVLESVCGTGSLTISLASSGMNSSGILKATNKISYSLQMNCKVILTAPHNHYIMLSIREIGLRKNTLVTCKDYLKIDDRRETCENIYREDEERHYQSKNNQMTILYYTSPDGLNNRTMSEYPGFTVTFTALRKASEKDNPCESTGNSSEIFLCTNNYCIWSGLTCDGHNNCGDLSDENPYENSNCGRSGRGSTVLIILGVLILLVLIIMCVATLVCTKNESVRRFSSRLRSRTISFIPKLR